jgi:uncharacterized phiE125 gp8 family phage protein
MSSILLTPPAVEPVTLAQAKSFLRVEHDDDDAAIAALIAGARMHVEAQTRRALMAQSWRIARDAWPESGRLALLPVPLRALTAVRIYQEGGAAQALDPDGFALDAASAPAQLTVPRDMPRPGRALAGIEIDFEAGYGASADDVPEPLRHAIQILVAHWYENRGVIGASGEVALLPESAAALIAPYRVLAL